jgi:hypothetical protein
MAVTLWNKKIMQKLNPFPIPAVSTNMLKDPGTALRLVRSEVPKFWVALGGNTAEKTCSAEEWIAIIFLEENVSVEIAFDKPLF